MQYDHLHGWQHAQDRVDQYRRDLAMQLRESFIAGQFQADFLPLACASLGSELDINAAERADPVAFGRMVDMGADEALIFTHFLIFSEQFRTDVFDSLIDQYARYMGI